MPVGAPPPESGRSDVLGPKTPVDTEIIESEGCRD